MFKNKKLLVLFVVIILIAPNVWALTQEQAGVVLLEPLPNLSSQSSETQVSGLTEYLSFIFPLAIGLAALLAVLMIVIGGIQYIFSSIPGVKGEGLKRIQEAIWGLLLALAAYLILHTINPDLVSLRFLIDSSQQQS